MESFYPVVFLANFTSGGMWGLVIGAFILLCLTTIIFLASRYKRCPSDKILVRYGKTSGGQAAQPIHGGGVLVWPLIQDCAYLSLTPMTISIPLQGALSMQNIRINVPSTFTVGVSTEPSIMMNAAERLLELRPAIIEEMAKEIIFGQLRLTVASLRIEEINKDRERFLDEIRRNVEPELNKIGLYLINVNITDITDESDYIDSIGKKAAAEAVNKAKVDVAEQEKTGAIGEAVASKEKTINVAENVAEAEKGQKKAEASKRIYVQQQESQAVSGENKAKAEIADTNSELAMKQAAANQRAEVAKREAVIAIQKAQYRAEQERLHAEEVVREEVNKQKIEIAAEAEANRAFKVAQGEANALLCKFEAEAKGVRQVLDAKAAGYMEMVKSCNGDAKAASTLLMIEKLEEIVGIQVEAIRNLKIDKVTVWDSGSGSEKGSSTANFLSSMVKSLPPLQDVAQMAGVELPEYLGKMAEKEEAPKAPNIPAVPQSPPKKKKEQ